VTANGYRESVASTARLLAEADFVVIGAGAGLSAASGLNYRDADLFARWYPQFYNLGIRSIWKESQHIALRTMKIESDSGLFRRFTFSKSITTPQRFGLFKSATPRYKEGVLRYQHER